MMIPVGLDIKVVPASKERFSYGIFNFVPLINIQLFDSKFNRMTNNSRT